MTPEVRIECAEHIPKVLVGRWIRADVPGMRCDKCERAADWVVVTGEKKPAEKVAPGLLTRED